ncbi:MAG: radical SAM protein [Chloroflexi bacterium]|nr:radical SAM protein [Chloroflexota bacterium]
MVYRLKLKERLPREQGTIFKDWGGKLPIALIYPNSYYVGMSNLGVQAIYGLLNRHSRVVCERVFWDGELPLAVESGRPLTDFSVLAFSISYELDYFNALQTLRAAGIPLHAAQRTDKHPLVIAGGPCIISNPAPLAPFFDLFGIGEAEVLTPPLLAALLEEAPGDRAALLASLGRVPGIYAPGYTQGKVVRQWVKKLDDHDVSSVVLTPDTELGDLYLVEAERGCAQGCRFCLVCAAFNPMRLHSTARILEQAARGLAFRRRIGLVGPSVSDHPDFENILAGVRGLGAELAVSSLRLSGLTPGILGELVKGGIRSIAIAPEAGSQRLRDVIRKGITESDILGAIGRAAAYGMKQLKLYFMIGLPSESDDDIEQIIRLTLAAKEVVDRSRAGTRLGLNISPFVPKAGTPFQWLPMAPVRVLNERITRLKKSLAARGVEAKYESPSWSEVQAVLARGDEQVAGVLTDMPEFTLAAWRAALARRGMDNDYYAHQAWSTDAVLPWSFIDQGVRGARLESELGKALAGA